MRRDPEPSTWNVRRASTWLPPLLAAWLGGASCGGLPVDGAKSEACGPSGEAATLDLDVPLGRPLVVRDAGPGAERRVARVRPGTYVRPPIHSDAETGVLVLEGARDLTLDLTGVDLRGTPAGTDLDLNQGWGIVLRSCERVTLRGGRLGGYKVCLAAFDCRGVVLDGIEFDGWYGARLGSTRAAEDPSDWLYPHHNDAGEWMTNYGAAIALNDCERVTVERCRGRHGQNGILLTRTRNCTVADVDFSFLSGWGIALYRASSNVVSRGRFDYCVRGYSHGVYWRGQDSAGILMFERSCDNLFEHCSATHGGDGVFLFAGLDTVEGHAFLKGELDAGGSDRNTWFECDFSHAVANAIEATFSRDNRAIGNRLDGAHQHGIWAGYSSRMRIEGNVIRGTQGGGISIEHGQECLIEDNVLQDNDLALELWWDEDRELVDGPFGRHRDTSSRDHFVARNRFEGNALDLVVTRTEGLTFADNQFRSTTGKLELEDVSGTDARGRAVSDPRALFRGPEPGLPTGRVRSSTLRAADGERPAWVTSVSTGGSPLPRGDRSRVHDRGASLGLESIVMGPFGPWDFESGEPRPAPREPGGLLAGLTWRATWFPWAPERDGRAGSDPRKDLAVWRALQASPSATGDVTSWVDPWGADPTRRKTVGSAHFGLVARATLHVATAGNHRLSTVSDDGVRVIVDGATVLENWTWHGPTRDTAEVALAAGPHELVLEYFQIDGAYALAIDLVSVAAR